MTLYMPNIERKKCIHDKFSPDTRRIFGRLDDGNHPPPTHYTSTHGKASSWSTSTGADIYQKPKGVGFLVQNCRTLHDPVCCVQTRVMRGTPKVRDSHWWPTILPPERKLTKRKCSPSTTSHMDYVAFEKMPPIATRHSSNPHRYASKGVVPVTRLPSERGPRLLVEHISYQHQYNSREAASLPPRGKLHGCFVWDVLHPEQEENA